MDRVNVSLIQNTEWTEFLTELYQAVGESNAVAYASLLSRSHKIATEMYRLGANSVEPQYALPSDLKQILSDTIAVSIAIGMKMGLDQECLDQPGDFTRYEFGGLDV
jgi:hypothetical protein